MEGNKRRGRILKRLRRKIACVILSIMLFNMVALSVPLYAVAVPDQSVIDDNFPESYQSQINALKAKHPNWTIKAFHTNLDWTTVINSEVSGTFSRIQDSAFGDAWKRLESINDSNYNAAGFVLASRSAVEYTMDPRNFLNDETIFQFRVIDKNVSSDTEAAVNQTMINTPMANTSYANIIKGVGDSQGVSPVFIASRIRQETSCNTVNNPSINGKDPDYPGYYNFFNIGASDSASSPVKYGIKLAYSKDWNTPQKAISGGIDIIKSKYINFGQNTVYFQKFDVANPYGNAKAILAYQYMSNVSAPEGEAKIAYNGMNIAGTLENAYNFYVPVYKNMPAIACPVPSTGYYLDDNTKVYLDDPYTNDASDTFNIRSAADDLISSNIVYRLTQSCDVNQKTVLTRVKKGVNTGWDYVEFTVGGENIRGYIKNSYVFEYPYNKVTGVTLNKTSMSLKIGNNETLIPTVLPNDAEFKNVTWSSSDNTIATVDTTGKVNAIKEGSANITVKTVDGLFVATCNVTVTAKDPSINLSKKQYNVIKDKSITINAIPSDTDISEYDLSVADESIAKIENGKLKGASAGTTKVIATLKGTSIKCESDVKVTDISMDSLTIDNSLTVSDDILTKIQPKTKVSEIKGKINYDNAVEVKNISGKVIGADELVGTGTTVSIKDINGDEIHSYTVVVYGDVNGDGAVSPSDYVKIKNHILKREQINKGLEIAGDPNKDSKISPSDYVKVKNYILGSEDIIQ